jgi:hypothetical protein
MKLKQTFLFTSFILSGVALLSLSTVLDGCKSKSTTYILTGDTIADGKYLVELHCTKCHSLVPANTLTKSVWRMHTLPEMARYLGISTYGPDFYKDPKDTGGISIFYCQAKV